MKGEYACRSPRLYSLHWICRKLAHSFDFSISHVRREHNAEANDLANSAVRQHLAWPLSMHRADFNELDVASLVPAALNVFRLMLPVPDRIAFVIPQHQRVRTFHNFSREDQISSTVFHLRSGNGKFVAFAEGHTHVVHKRLWAEVKVDDVLTVFHQQVDNLIALSEAA